MKCVICGTEGAYVGLGTKTECVNIQCRNYSEAWAIEYCSPTPQDIGAHAWDEDTEPIINLPAILVKNEVK